MSLPCLLTERIFVVHHRLRKRVNFTFAFALFAPVWPVAPNLEFHSSTCKTVFSVDTVTFFVSPFFLLLLILFLCSPPLTNQFSTIRKRKSSTFQGEGESIGQKTTRKVSKTQPTQIGCIFLNSYLVAHLHM